MITMTEYMIVGISFAAAFIFSLGGVGAAVIIIPVLVSFGIPIGIAKPVGLFYNTVILAGTSIWNIRNKRLDFKIGIPIIILSFLFAIVGAWISQFIPKNIVLILITSSAGILGAVLGTMFLHNKLAPKTIKKILAVILLVMAVKLAIGLWK